MFRVLLKNKILNFTTLHSKATSDLKDLFEISTNVEKNLVMKEQALTLRQSLGRRGKWENSCSFSLSAGSHWFNLNCLSLLQVCFSHWWLKTEKGWLVGWLVCDLDLQWNREFPWFTMQHKLRFPALGKHLTACHSCIIYSILAFNLLSLLAFSKFYPLVSLFQED